MSQSYTHIKTHAHRLARQFLEWLEPASQARHQPDDLLKPSAAGTSGTASAPTPKEWARQTSENTPTYPPFRNGLPSVTAEQVVRSQDELIRSIYRATGVAPELWRSLYMPIIYAYAGHAHLLPASETNHHRGAGGLFQHGLEAAYHAVRLVDGKDAGQKSAHKEDTVDRKKNDERLRFTTFCAALLHDVGKPISDMTVVANDGGAVWNPLLEYLPEWAAIHGVERYHINWREKRKERHEAVSAILLPRLMGNYALAWMHETKEGALWVDLLSKSLVNYETGSNKVRDNATRGDQKSSSEDLAKRAESGNDIGIPLERFMLNACREMLFESVWTVNDKGGVIWVCKAPDEGIERPFAPGTPVVALLWPRAGEAIIAKLRSQGTPGVPRDPNLVARMLIDRSIAVPARPSTENNSYISEWQMLAPANDKENGMGSADTALAAAIGQKVLVLANAENILDYVPLASNYRLSSGNRTTTSAGNGEASTPSAVPTQQASPAGRSSPTTTAHKTQNPAPRPPAPTPKANEFHQPIIGREPIVGNGPAASMEAPQPNQSQATSGSDTISTATRILRTMVNDIALKRRDASIVVPAGNSAMLRFPQAFEDFGFKPLDILKMLNEEGMIKPDPVNPEKLTQTMNLPGGSKPSNVVVLSEQGIMAAPCLGVSHVGTTPEQVNAARAYLTSIAASCPKGRFVAEKSGAEDGTGFWFLPADWAIHHLRSWSDDKSCPEWVLRHFDSGPGTKDAEGPSIRFKASTE
jgi:conjugal transfer pilus assembly protein TraI